MRTLLGPRRAALRGHDDRALGVGRGSVGSGRCGLQGSRSIARALRLCFCSLCCGRLRRAQACGRDSIVHHGRLEVDASGQRVGHDVLDSRDVLDLVVELGHLLDPACESARQMRHGLVILERVVVREQGEGQVAVQVLTPVAAGVDERHELLLARVVVDLSGLELARHVGHGLQSVAVVLLQGRTDRVVACITVERIRQSGVRDEQHRRAAQRPLESVERRLLQLAPYEGSLGLLGQLGDGQRDLAEVLDEAAVEACKPEE